LKLEDPYQVCEQSKPLIRTAISTAKSENRPGHIFGRTLKGKVGLNFRSMSHLQRLKTHIRLEIFVEEYTEWKSSTCHQAFLTCFRVTPGCAGSDILYGVVTD
jgi:hypothetical protein